MAGGWYPVAGRREREKREGEVRLRGGESEVV